METKNTPNVNTAEMTEKILARMKEQSFEVLHALDESTVNACAINRDLIRRILSDNQYTEYGKKHGFSNISNIDEYRRIVPLTSYSDYEPYYTMSYASSEGIFGVARHAFDQYYCMIPGSCFYEFIPMDGKTGDEENPQTLLMDELEDGKEYELVITNQSGFYRYRMGDVIKVIGFYHETPMIVFKYRKKNIVSIAGEKFTEDHLLSAIREFERRSDINIIDFCMYPDRDVVPGRYVILLEPEEVVPQERLSECQDILSEELARASTSYAHYVAGGNMGKPKIVFLQQEAFAFHREVKMFKMGLSENQIKTPRVLSTPEEIKFFTSQAERYRNVK